MSRPLTDQQAAHLSVTRTEPDHAAQPPAWDWDWDDYLYPLAETGGVEVLRNNLSLRDEQDLRFAERALSAGRQLELAADPDLVPRTFDVAHWQGIHRHLFGEVYPWAGQFRTVDLAKDTGLGLFTPFLDSEEIPQQTGRLLEGIRSQDMFAGRAREGVLAGLTITLQSTNLIHPFREGNGRVQRVLAEHIAEHAGYRLDWSQISTGDQRASMIMAFYGEPEHLYDALDRALRTSTESRLAPSTSPVSDADPGPARWPFNKTTGQILTEARAQAAAAPADPSAQPAALSPALHTGHRAGAQIGLGD